MNYGEVLSSFLIDLQRLFRVEISDKNVTYSQVLTLVSIPDNGIEMSSLAQILGIDSSTATRLVIRLEKKGWVRRKHSDLDRRIIKVFLTMKGQNTQSKLDKKIEILGQQIENEVDVDDRDDLLQALSSFHWTLSKLLFRK